MVDLNDWDFPIPDSIIITWLSLLETVVWGGSVIFAIALLHAGGFVPLPFSPSGGIVVAVLAVLFAVITTVKLKHNDIYF